MESVNIALTIILGLIVVLASIMTWQHQRYASARLQYVQDHQSAFYNSGTFHAMIFFKVADDADVISMASDLVSTLETNNAGKLIYVGQSAFTNGTTSVSNTQWSGVVLMQYAARGSFDAVLKSETFRSALGRFESTYAHGMNRPGLLNVMMNQALLALAVMDIFTGGEAAEPLVAVKDEDLGPGVLRLREIEERLRALAPINDEAILVFNLSRPGTDEQQAADASYGRKMITRMARGAHGPLHIGEAVSLDDQSGFENAVLVYYPGANYFADLITSTFFTGIIGDKQLGENLSMPTVPIIRQVRELQKNN